MLLRQITNTQRTKLAALAEGWLASGATTFEIRAGGRTLVSWTATEREDGDSAYEVTAPISVDGRQFGELRVVGLDSHPVHARLEAEAELVAQLVQQERDLRLMTSDLVQTQDQLLSLYKLTRTTRHHQSLQEILAQLASETLRLIDIAGVFMLVTSVDGPFLVEHYPVPMVDTDTLHTFLEELERSGLEEMWWNDPAASEQPGGAADNAPEEARLQAPDGIHNLLMVRKQIHNSVTVALGLINKKGGEFSTPDIKLAQVIAENGAGHIENMLLYEEALEQARMRTEMELAQSVQLNLLPEQAPKVEGLDLWAESRPASRVGGDFYDFLRKPHEPFTFVVGDVSGKGMPSAMLMAMARSVIRAKVRSGLTPEAILQRANGALYDDFTRVSMFATTFIGQYQAANQEIVYANAGHSPVIYCPAGGPARLLEADGTAMGILPTSLSQDQRLQLGEGDLMVVATDGFNEAWNDDEEMFGYDRLLQTVESLAHLPAHELALDLYGAVTDFSGGRQQEDDQTLLVLKRPVAS